MAKALVFLIIVAVVLGGAYALRNGVSLLDIQKNNNNILPMENSSQNVVTITTNLGEIQFETYNSDAPNAVKNFITLAEKGFYDNLMFHRVIKDFMIQGGDPKGDGTGGPGYQFADELDPNTPSYQAGYKKGVVAMANSGSNTNGSQFFIILEDTPLQKNYTIFGKVIKGQEVVDAIGKVQTDPNDKPLSAVRMEKVSVSEKEGS